MTKILVDGVEVDVPPEFTLLQACEEAGAEVPRFCYHERLSIRRQLPHVPRRSKGRPAQNRRLPVRSLCEICARVL